MKGKRKKNAYVFGRCWVNGQEISLEEAARMMTAIVMVESAPQPQGDTR